MKLNFKLMPFTISPFFNLMFKYFFYVLSFIYILLVVITSTLGIDGISYGGKKVSGLLDAIWIWGVFYVAILFFFIILIMQITMVSKICSKIRSLFPLTKKRVVMGLVSIFVIGSAFLGSISYIINSSKYLKTIIEVMNSNDRIVQFLGSPIKKVGLVVAGSVRTKDAELEFNVKGTKKEAVVKAEVFENDDHWFIQKLTLTESGGLPQVFIDTEISVSNNIQINDQNSFEKILSSLEKQTSGDFMLARLRDNYDVMQVEVYLSKESTACFILRYSDGLTNQNFYQADNACLNKSEILKDLYAYGTGSDAWKKNRKWFVSKSERGQTNF